jgi:hypothetical protein
MTAERLNSWGLLSDRDRDFFITVILQTSCRDKPAFFRVDNEGQSMKLISYLHLTSSCRMCGGLLKLLKYLHNTVLMHGSKFAHILLKVLRRNINTQKRSRKGR